ncbi:MAG: choice-of-anchor Q domain-containing protein, partial [Planctomycetota bacterium]
MAGCKQQPDANNTNIDADPRFVDPNNPDTNLRNLRLKPDSPCIDAGNNTVVLAMSVAYDLDSKDRYIDIDNIDDTGSGLFEFIDMGAYEFNCDYTPGDINCDGVVDFKDMAILCNNWLAG